MRLPVFVLAALLPGFVLADDPIPLLDDIGSIYVLGSFDIPDQPVDRDGFRDRPRYVIWPESQAVSAGDPGMDLGLIRKRVLALLGERYKTVSKWSWEHENHRTEEKHRGAIVMQSGEFIGWWMDKGGLAYLEFGYDPAAEKMGRWQSGLSIRVPAVKRRIYRVPECSAKILPKGTEK